MSSTTAPLSDLLTSVTPAEIYDSQSIVTAHWSSLELIGCTHINAHVWYIHTQNTEYTRAGTDTHTHTLTFLSPCNIQMSLFPAFLQDCEGKPNTSCPCSLCCVHEEPLTANLSLQCRTFTKCTSVTYMPLPDEFTQRWSNLSPPRQVSSSFTAYQRF